MKKIILGIFIFLGLGINSTFAISFGTYSLKNSNYTIEYTSGNVKLYDGLNLIQNTNDAGLNGRELITGVYMVTPSPGYVLGFTDYSFYGQGGGVYSRLYDITNTVVYNSGNNRPYVLRRLSDGLYNDVSPGNSTYSIPSGAGVSTHISSVGNEVFFIKDTFYEIGTSILDDSDYTCETKYINYAYPQNESFSANTQILDNSDEYTIIEEGQSSTLLRFNSHSGSLIDTVNGDSTFSIKSSLNPFSDGPLMLFRFPNTISTILISGSGSFENPEGKQLSQYYNISNCIDTFLENPKYINSIDSKSFQFGERYNLDSSYRDICLHFPTKWNTELNLTRLNFGNNTGIQVEETYICSKNDTGEVFTGLDPENLESYTGSIDNIGKNGIVVSEEIKAEKGGLFDYIGGEKTLNLNQASSGAINSLSGSIEEKFQLSEFTKYWHISLPTDPNLSIQVPYLSVNDNFNIEYHTGTGELLPITDRLGKSDIVQSNTSKYAFTFMLGIFYISIRLGLLAAVFYIFRLYYKAIDMISTSIFGKSIRPTSSGNIWSLIFYISFLTSLILVFIGMFAYMLPFIDLINIITNYVTVLFSFVTVSFFDYYFFSTMVNYFFHLLVISTTLYIIYELVNKFGKLN